MRKYATFSDAKAGFEQTNTHNTPQSSSLFCEEPDGVKKWKLVADIPLEDIKRLCDAWRDGRAVILPFGLQSDQYEALQVNILDGLRPIYQRAACLHAEKEKGKDGLEQ